MAENALVALPQEGTDWRAIPGVTEFALTPELRNLTDAAVREDIRIRGYYV